MKKLKFLRRLILLLIVFGLLFTCCYTYFISPKDYHFSKYSYINENINSDLNGFKIAFFSDLHLSDEKSIHRLKNIVDDLNKEPFDMIIFGGDLFDFNIFQNKDISKILKNIDCQYGKFAILGDQDQQSSLEITQILNEGGFEVLKNEARTLYYRNTSFVLYASDADYDLSQIKKDSQTIKMSVVHQPDSFIKNNEHVQLQLSGHSCGGSIYIPYFGALLTPNGAKTYNHGIYKKDKSTLLVSNGVSGPSSFPYKFLAKNEINIITLQSSVNH